MKKLILLFIVLQSLVLFVSAQQATSFDVDGIKVIFKPTVKNVISVRMFYRGGVTNYPAKQAGIESFTLKAATDCGTQKYNANVFKDRTDKYGVIMSSGSEFDYGDISMECVSKYFNEGWDLLSEAVTNPVFDAAQVELLRSKMISRIRQLQSDPDDHVRQLLMANAFANTPYATDPDGDEDAVNSMTASDLKNYYSSILNKNKLFIVVAGKISKDELVEKIKASFASLPAKPYTPFNYEPPLWNDYKVLTEKRDLSTNYVNGIMNAPPVNSDDYMAYRLGISVLGGQIFNELRTHLHLSYDPGATSVMQLMPYAVMYVSTSSPKEAVKAMTEQLNMARSYVVTDKGLQELRSNYITNYYMGQQGSSNITESLGKAEISGGWEMAENLPALLDKVSVGQIRSVMNKYISGLRWAYLGDSDLAKDAGSAFNKKVK